MNALPAPSPYVLGMEAFGEPLVPSGYDVSDETAKKHMQRFGSGQKLSTLASNTELVIRPLTELEFATSLPHDRQHLGAFAGELLYLDQTIGLHTPGLSVAKESSPTLDGLQQLFLVTHRVHGFSFRDSLAALSPRIAQLGGYQVIAYYNLSHRKRGPGMRLADLTIRQLVHGDWRRQQMQLKNYMVDMDPDMLGVAFDDQGRPITGDSVKWAIRASGHVEETLKVLTKAHHITPHLAKYGAAVLKGLEASIDRRPCLQK